MIDMKGEGPDPDREVEIAEGDPHMMIMNTTVILREIGVMDSTMLLIRPLRF